ncbi:hypothetical protein AAC387_Pa09g1484 [Persea americana]
MDQIERLIGQNGLVIFSKSSCCMCHAMKTFFNDFGANAVVKELDNGSIDRELEWALIRQLGCNPPVPVVFVGGKLVGTTNDVNRLHIEGKLIPMLIRARVIWLCNPNQSQSLL